VPGGRNDIPRGVGYFLLTSPKFEPNRLWSDRSNNGYSAKSTFYDEKRRLEIDMIESPTILNPTSAQGAYTRQAGAESLTETASIA
jgi:hypothetical protein